jgi:acid-sensing ion channel, other
MGKNISALDYPLMSSSRNGNGLKITLEILKHSISLRAHDACRAPTFIVHSPFELPGSYDSNERIDFYYGNDLEVLITPEIIKTDPDLKNYEPKQRGCYFEGEKKLNFFKIYTRRNCEFECYAEHFLKKIGCVPFFMVRNKTTEVCDSRSGLAVEIEFYYALRNADECQCLDECDSIKYDLTSKNPFTSVSMHFKFKDLLIAPLRRYQPFTFSEFLAQSGGILGLFAGISALSIIELFYFMTLRWMMNLLRRWKKK